VFFLDKQKACLAAARRMNKKIRRFEKDIERCKKVYGNSIHFNSEMLSGTLKTDIPNKKNAGEGCPAFLQIVEERRIPIRGFPENNR